MIYPLSKVFITQKFGENKKLYEKYGMIGHNGLDFRTKFWDTPLGRRYIYAIQYGVITDIKWDKTGYGYHIRQRGKDGHYLYAHLSKIYVAKNQTVNEGKILGISGSTGDSTAPHLHFGWRPLNFDYGNGYAGYEDPEKLFKKASTFNIHLVNCDIAQQKEFMSRMIYYTGSKPNINLSTSEFDINVSEGTLLMDDAMKIVDKINQVNTQCYILMYNGNQTSSFEVTSYYPAKNCSLITIPKPVPTTVMVHAMIHGLRKYINFNHLGEFIEDVEKYPTSWADIANFDNSGWQFAKQYEEIRKYFQ